MLVATVTSNTLSSFADAINSLTVGSRSMIAPLELQAKITNNTVA